MSSPETIESVIEAMREGRRWRVVLIYGNNTFLLREAVDRIVETLLPASDRSMALEIFEGTADPGIVVDAIRTYSFIPGSKIVWVRDVPYFYSKDTQLDLMTRAAREQSDGRRDRAADLVLQAVASAGWEPQDVMDGEWKRMPDAVWREGMGFDRDIAALAWLDAVLSTISIDAQRTSAGDNGILEQALEQGWPEGHVLILTAPAVDRRKVLFKAIFKAGLVLDCSIETRTQKDRKDAAAKMREVTVGRLDVTGKRIRPDAMRVLEERVGADPGRLSQEIDKLAGYVGTSSEITRSDVEAMVAPSDEAALYELNEAVMQGESGKAFVLLKRLLESGCHPLAIVSSLANEVRRLMGCRGAMDRLPDDVRIGAPSYSRFETAILPALKTAGYEWSAHPYAQYQTYLRAARQDHERLRRIHRLLLEADLSLKSGGASRLTMDRFILECAQSAASSSSPRR